MALEKSIKLQVGVKILLKNSNGKYLLLLRSSDVYADSGNIWDFPGGRIDAGVGLIENLKREVYEETSIGIEGNPRLVAAQDIMPTEDRHIVRLTYIADTEVDGEPSLSEEHSDYGWFSPDDMKTLDGLDSYLKTLVDEGILDAS